MVWIAALRRQVWRQTAELRVESEERKALQAQFLQAQKMEAVGQLAGGVAHDLNNILASTMLHLGLLEMKPDLDPETREALGQMKKGAQRAAAFTRQLLMFSRRSMLEVKTVDLSDLISDLLKMLRRMIGEHVAVHFESDPTVPTVEADPGMIEQVVMNLCVNARDAMPKGGTITIGLKAVQVEKSQLSARPGVKPGTFACLSVADTGCGMDEATLKRAFEPFFTTKEVGKGTGLGLATVDGIVGQHNGWVEAESRLGEGTTFRVFLPVSAKRVIRLPSVERSEGLRGNETILLVEDESELRLITRQGLRHLGYRVHEAANGQEALAVWRQHHEEIHLLFSDMIMPGGMTGLELAERLRKEKPDLRVVLCSGYDTEVAGRCSPCEAIARRLPKPYQVEDLAKTIRGCLDGE